MATGVRLEAGVIFAGDFRVVRAISESADGAAFLVEQVSSGTERTLELLPSEVASDSSLRERFLREARVGARIESDHVADVIAAGFDPESGVPWIATENLKGNDLSKHVAENGPRPVLEVREIFAQLAHALGVAHAAGVVHGDLEPGNVFLAAPRSAGVPFTIKVLHFGVGRLLVEARTKRGMPLSTSLAPEQADPSLAITPSTDVWALGMLAFFALTGRTVARGAEVGIAHLLPTGFDTWLARCLARDPFARFSSAREACAALDPILAPHSSSSPIDDVNPFAPRAPSSPVEASNPYGPRMPSQPAPPPPYIPPPPPPMADYAPSTSSSGGAAWVLVPILIGVLLLGVVGVAVGGFVLARKRSHAVAVARPDAGHPTAPHVYPKGTWSDTASPIPVSSDDPTWGDRDALVTVVAFEDFQCPFCRRLVPTLDAVKSRYGARDVRIVWKNQPLPFHTRAMPSAEAGRGVFEIQGDAAFWAFHDAVYASAGDAAALSDTNLESYATAAGLHDVTQLRLGLSSHRWQPRVEMDAALAKTLGASGTPTCFVNGVLLSGAQPIEKFETVIDAEKRKAEAKVAAGTPRDRIYVVMSTENKSAAPTAPKADAPKEDDKTVWRVPVGDSPVLGPSTALVTIIEFSDFQCPFCSRVGPTLKALMAKYGQRLRIVWKNEPLPFHPRAEPAAQLALEARAEKGNGGFWAAHDLLFDNQKALADDDLYGYGAKLGLNAALVRSAIQTHRYKSEIDADKSVGDDFAASGTPHFFINGRRLVGAQPQTKFETMIDEEIAKANDLLAKGVASSRIYDELTRDGRGPSALERKSVALTPNSPWRGGAGAKVVIQEFGDFQCPFCYRAEDTLRQVSTSYGDRVKIVWRDLPLSMHADASLAAQAAREAYRQKGLKGFWAMHDKMYAHQSDLKRTTLDEYAQDLGLDMNQWASALASGTHKAVIDADVKAANDAGITGTPGFVINGYYVSGAQPFEKMKKVIDLALAEAK